MRQHSPYDRPLPHSHVVVRIRLLCQAALASWPGNTWLLWGMARSSQSISRCSMFRMAVIVMMLYWLPTGRHAEAPEEGLILCRDTP